MAASIFLLFVAFIAAAAIAGRIEPSPVSTATKAERSTRSAKADFTRVYGPQRILGEDLGKQYCIGGSMCPDYCDQAGKGCKAQSLYSLELGRPAGISHIELHARDEVVLKRPAQLVVKLDGRQLGTFQVRWTGSTLSIPVNRMGQRITIESRDPHGARLAGEEAIISEVQVFGRDLQ